MSYYACLNTVIVESRLPCLNKVYLLFSIKRQLQST